MRFLMLNWRDPENPLSGGAERVTYMYMRDLVQRGHEAYWFANEFSGCKPETVIDGIKIVRGGGKGSSVLKARAWYKQQPRFDLVIDQHHGIPWFAPWWCGTNNIAYIHEVLGPIWRSFYPEPVATLGRWQERWTHWFYRDVPFWVPSESTRTALLEHGVKEVQVWPNGIDTKPLIALPPKPIESPLRLIVVCRLAPNKRVDQAIHVLRELKNRRIAAELTIVGTGEVEQKLKELTVALGLKEIVHFKGRLPEAEKNQELSNAHWLLHTSVREGWGLNVTEANAMGTPAAVYPVGGLIDSTKDQMTGLVSKTENPASLADALEASLPKPENYAEMRFNAWRLAGEHQWEKVLSPVSDWLEQMAKKRGGQK